MPLSVDRFREIHPAVPDQVVGDLLTLPVARILPMSLGDVYNVGESPQEYALVASVQGNLTVNAHDRYALLSTGQLYVLPADGPYEIHAVSDCLCMTVHVKGEAARRLLERDAASGTRPQGAAAVREAVLTLAILEDEDNAPVKGNQASSFAYAMLMKLRGLTGARAPAGSALVESAIAIIQAEFPFLDGLDELAERLEVSKAHLSRCFVHTVGISPGKYIIRVKIEYAKLLLQGEDASISYVAEASGFANANYFAKVFRRETGMSPSEYMESAPRRERSRPPQGPIVW